MSAATPTTAAAAGTAPARGWLAGLFWVHLLSYAVLPLGLAMRLLYARVLSVEEYGLFYAAAGLLLLFTGFGDLGLGQAMTHYGLRHRSRGEADGVRRSVVYALRLQLASTLALSAVLALAAGTIATHAFGAPDSAAVVYALIVYFACALPTRAIANVGLLRDDYLFARLFEPLRLLATLGLAVALAVLDLASPTTIAVSWALASALALGVYLVWYQARFRALRSVAFEPDPMLVRRMIGYAGPSVLVVMASTLLVRIDVQVLAWLSDMTAVAHYENASAIASLLVAALTPATLLVFTMASQLADEADSTELALRTERLLRFVVIGALPFSIAGWTLGADLLSLLFGSEYAPAAAALRWLSAGAFFSLLTSFTFALLAGLGMVRRRLRIVYLGAAFNLVGDLVAVRLWGAEGAAVVTLLLFTGMSGLALRAVRERVAFPIAWRQYRRLAVAALVFGATLAAVGQATVGRSEAIRLVAALGPGFAFYAAAVLALGVVDRPTVARTLREVRAMVGRTSAPRTSQEDLP